MLILLSECLFVYCRVSIWWHLKVQFCQNTCVIIFRVFLFAFRMFLLLHAGHFGHLCRFWCKFMQAKAKLLTIYIHPHVRIDKCCVTGKRCTKKSKLLKALLLVISFSFCMCASNIYTQQEKFKWFKFK